MSVPMNITSVSPIVPTLNSAPLPRLTLIKSALVLETRPKILVLSELTKSPPSVVILYAESVAPAVLPTVYICCVSSK